jgi:hypothetical protein
LKSQDETAIAQTAFLKQLTWLPTRDTWTQHRLPVSGDIPPKPPRYRRHNVVAKNTDHQNWEIA